DGAERVLVVERHIAAGDRRAERLASVAHSAHGFAKLVVDLGLSRIAEVEIVRDRQRPTTGTRHVPGGLGDRDPGAHAGIEIAIAAVAVCRYRETLAGPADPQRRGVAAGADDRVRADGGIVLAVHPGLAGDRWRREQSLERPPRIRFLRSLRDQ